MKFLSFGHVAIMRAILAIVAGVMVSGCYSQKSFDDYTESRRQGLLAIYPPGKTTMEDVRAKWNLTPQIEASRPVGGWDTHPNAWVCLYAPKAEKRIGRKIPKLERYFGPDGMFSLCYCWYFYDSRGRLLDVEWQWSSD